MLNNSQKKLESTERYRGCCRMEGRHFEHLIWLLLLLFVHKESYVIAKWFVFPKPIYYGPMSIKTFLCILGYTIPPPSKFVTMFFNALYKNNEASCNRLHLEKYIRYVILNISIFLHFAPRPPSLYHLLCRAVYQDWRNILLQPLLLMTLLTALLIAYSFNEPLDQIVLIITNNIRMHIIFYVFMVVCLPWSQTCER